jgi:long-chain acyl-CoA synthetase
MDTFPKLLLANAERFRERIAIREKNFGIWQSWTWAQVRQEVETLACGFAALGLQRGERIAIVGDNRPRLYWAMTAAQTLGAIPVPLYQDSVASELAYVIEHSEARFAIVEDQEQVDKFVEIRPKAAKLERVLFDDPKGLRHYQQDWLQSYDSVQGLGRRLAQEQPGFFEARVAETKADDLSIMLYTSGTTGNPKGVMLTHRNMIETARGGIVLEKLDERDEVLAYLPMAWVGDHLFSYGQSFCAGFAVNCPESGATVMHDLQELGPTYFFAPPRIFENLLTQLTVRMDDAGAVKRRMYQYFMGLARRVGERILDGAPVPLSSRLLYALGQVLVYGPIRNTLGMTRVRLAYTAGEAIGPEIFSFFRALGINLKQLYGMTEASVFITIQPDGEVRPDTVGVPAPGVEIKLAQTGEVLFRSPGVFVGYYKNPQATRETKTEDGWVHTGDAGYFADNGHLRIVDRAKDVGRLTDGTLFAPKYIENKLKFFPSIKEAVAFGDGRGECTAFINIDLMAVGSWAERRGIAYGSYQELAAHSEVYDLVADCIGKLNRELSVDPALAGSQIHRFLILHKELDADDGELTRTRKVRRRFIADHYRPLIEALYSGVGRAHIDSEVTFEDGRKGRLSADLRIAEVATYPKAAPAEKPGLAA